MDRQTWTAHNRGYKSVVMIGDGQMIEIVGTNHAQVASLVASAPDMLAPLEFALPILEGIKGIQHGIYECDLIKIRAAIAKAKGLET